MREVFIDKDVLLGHVRRMMFDERSPLATEVVLRQVQRKKLVGYISSVTPFMLVNYLIYKFRRKNGSAENQMAKDETRSVDCIVKALSGTWGLVDLSFDEVKTAFVNRKTHFEDSYQHACAEKVKPNYLITWNVRHFSFSKTLKVANPKQYMEKLLKDGIITEKDVDSIRKTSDR